MDSLAQHKYTFGVPRMVNDDARGTYNNQPMFDGSVLYFSAIRDGKQSDIYAYDIPTASLRQVTNTPHMSEYSPTLMPDGKDLSTVCIEADGVTQRLYALPKDGTGAEKCLMDSVFNVGYHVWMEPWQLALFVVGEPHQLCLVHPRTQEKVTLEESIGRCIKKAPSGELSFTHNTTDEEVFIKLYNPKTKRTARLVRLLPDSEDYAWMPNGSLLMGSGSKLYQFTPGVDADWVELADFKIYGIAKISRIAVMGNGGVWLALVGGQ